MYYLLSEPIAQLPILVKSSFWRQFLLVGTARAGKPVLKIVTKIADFPRIRSCAIGSSLLFLLLTLHPLAAKEATLAHPPKGWESIADRSQLPQKVKVIYMGTAASQNGFTPSLNIASEATDMTLAQYVAVAKEYHEQQKGTRCTPLGKIKTEFGEAELLQIDRPSQWGEIRFLQAMLIRDNEAYVVTATCLKKEFSLYSTAIFQAVQSLRLL